MKRRALLLTAGSLPLLSRAAANSGYRVIDLMPDYWAFEAQASGLDPAQQAALFQRVVAARHPEAYAARVIGIDPQKPYAEELAKRYIAARRALADRSVLMRRLSFSIASDLPRYEARFREVFPDLAYRGDIYFMHSLGGFDGGTREVNGRTALLFGIDMIAYVYGEDVDPQPFFHHELFHLYHAQFNPERQDEDPIGSALWREGLATFVAQTLNPAAGGVSIFGLPRSTPERVREQLPALAKVLRGVLDSRDAREYARFFLGAREDAETPARSGYVVGYLVAQELARRQPLQQLARRPFTSLRGEIQAALERMAAGG